MQAKDANLLDFISGPHQYMVPIYQRKYSWGKKECEQFWNDIERSSSDHVPVHFFGSIVYVKDDMSRRSGRSQSLIIDGQQRLTTTILLLTALSRKADEIGLEDIRLSKKIRNRYLIDPDESGDQAYKLILSKSDRDILNDIVSGHDLSDMRSHRLVDNFNLFYRWIGDDKKLFYKIFDGLAKLKVVDVTLKRGEDNPQLIFESMNSTGKKLSQADLIRNFVLMDQTPKEQEELYKKYWKPIEDIFEKDSNEARFDPFMRDYLTAMTGKIPNIGDVYEAYKDYFRKRIDENCDVEYLLNEVKKYSRYYAKFVFDQEKNPKLASAFADIKELKVDVVHPFFLKVYSDYEDNLLDIDTFNDIVRIIENYVFRRSICSIGRSPINTLFATFYSSLKDKSRYLESVKARLLGLKNNLRFPSDDEFYNHLQTRDIYNFRNKDYLLRKLEHSGKKEKIDVSNLSIEHIMPQNPNLSDEWKKSLGKNWKDIHEKYLHTLGNLTLTGYNSEYSNKPFEEKRDMKNGFKDSPLVLNRILGRLLKWDKEAITGRGKLMARTALEIWKAPASIDADLVVVDNAKENEYDIEDHQALMLGSRGRELFDEFRQEIMKFNPRIDEKVLKFYISYKMNTSFVDVIPQKDRLRLTINMDLVDLDDPQGIVEDISKKGHLGIGNSQVKLESMADMPYVLDLVKQSLNAQVNQNKDLQKENEKQEFASIS